MGVILFICHFQYKYKIKREGMSNILKNNLFKKIKVEIFFKNKVIKKINSY